jgi:hypothetical protein
LKKIREKIREKILDKVFHDGIEHGQIVGYFHNDAPRPEGRGASLLCSKNKKQR